MKAILAKENSLPAEITRIVEACFAQDPEVVHLIGRHLKINEGYGVEESDLPDDASDSERASFEVKRQFLAGRRPERDSSKWC